MGQNDVEIHRRGDIVSKWFPNTHDSQPDNGHGHLQRANYKSPPARPPPPEKVENISTDKLIDGIDSHLDTLKNSVRILKGRNSPDAHEELYKMTSKTEQELHQLNRTISLKRNGAGKPNVYRSLSQDENDTESLVQNLLAENDRLTAQMENLKTTLNEERHKLEYEETRNADLLLRLSKVAGQKLMENNPAIADLNDQNRPTKLGEVFSELYDNEWTEALIGLQAEGYKEEKVIDTLYKTLFSAYNFCKRKAETMLKKTDEAVNFLFEEYKMTNATEETKGKKNAMSLAMSSGRASRLEVGVLKNFQEDLALWEMWKRKSSVKEHEKIATLMVGKSTTVASKIKILQKETAESMVPVVQKAYIKANWIDGEFVPALKPYIRKCVFLCWMMVVQSPQMCFHVIDVQKDTRFNKNIFKEYTVSGPMVKFVVWPALLLHENGPLISKGVAQGCAESHTCP